MKKIISLICILVICFISTSCANYVEDEELENQDSYSQKVDNTTDVEENFGSIIADSLYDALKERYSTNLYDLDKTKISLGSVETESFGWTVYGTYTLYDKYGNIDSDHYNEKFIISINTNGAAYCTLVL